MNILKQMISEQDIDITNMSTPAGFKDFTNIRTGANYRIASDDQPGNEQDDEWLSIALDPMVYPEEVVSMCYE
jgi:hypothetical protein